MKRVAIILTALVFLAFQGISHADEIWFGAALSLTGKLAKEGNLAKNGYEP